MSKNTLKYKSFMRVFVVWTALVEIMRFDAKAMHSWFNARMTDEHGNCVRE